MSVHLTDESRFHSWEAKSEPEVGNPSDSTVLQEKGDVAYILNTKSYNEFIVCQKDALVEVRR
jgi:hypothetical protein